MSLHKDIVRLVNGDIAQKTINQFARAWGFSKQSDFKCTDYYLMFFAIANRLDDICRQVKQPLSVLFDILSCDQRHNEISVSVKYFGLSDMRSHLAFRLQLLLNQVYPFEWEMLYEKFETRIEIGYMDAEMFWTKTDALYKPRHFIARLKAWLR